MNGVGPGRLAVKGQERSRGTISCICASAHRVDRSKPDLRIYGFYGFTSDERLKRRDPIRTTGTRRHGDTVCSVEVEKTGTGTDTECALAVRQLCARGRRVLRTQFGRGRDHYQRLKIDSTARMSRQTVRSYHHNRQVLNGHGMGRDSDAMD